MKVIFLRHGESEYNVKGLINQDPTIKVHLTARGKKQLRETAKKLEGIEFDAIYVSDFVRTKESAEIINRGRNVPIIVDKRIGEAKTGFEGDPPSEFRLNSAHDFYNFKLKGRESWHDVMKRIKSFLKELKKEKYENVLVVTHEWIVKITDEIINGLTDEEARKTPFGNAEFFEFEL